MSDRRAPIIAAVAVVALVGVAVLFLVLPKRGQLSDANAALQQAQSNQTSLEAQVRALQQAKVEAPDRRSEIRAVEAQLPPTVDEPGAVRSLQNAFDESGVEVGTLTFGAPTLGTDGNFSIVPVSVQVSGGYFALDSFLSKIETFPRAAKVTAITISPTTEIVGTLTETILTMQVTMDLYTSDVSAGPGSLPGPTEKPGTSGGAP